MVLNDRIGMGFVNLGPFPKRPLDSADSNAKLGLFPHCISLSVTLIDGCRFVCLLVDIKHVVSFCDEYVHEGVFEIIWMTTYVFQKYVFACVQCVAVTLGHILDHENDMFMVVFYLNKLVLNRDVHKWCKNADLSENSLSNVIIKMHLKNSLKTTPNVYTFNVKEVRK